MLNVVFFAHPGILVLVRHYFILDIAEPFVEAVDLCSQVLDVLHHLVRLLLLLVVFGLRVLKLLLLIVPFLPGLLQFVLVLLDQVLELFDVSLELDHLTVPLLVHLIELCHC